MDNKLGARSLVGDSANRVRVDNDYYATPHNSTLSLMEVEKFDGIILEPCVGGGHIADILKQESNISEVVGVDIVDRGWSGTIVKDYFEFEPGFEVDHVITNPPYSLAQKFLEKSMSVVKDNGKVAMFLKIQFLEGKARKEMFKQYPPKKVYVFSERQNPLRNGSPVDENGKKWSSTMCFAWFVWEKGFVGKPEIEWL